MDAPTAVQLDRAAGALLGLAAGDALGAGYEFRTPPSGDAEMIGGGLGDWAPGEWTDDTQMAICIAEPAATAGLDPTPVGERFLEWLASSPPDVGIQTRSVLGSARDAAELPEAARRHFERNPESSAGNGSLMRTAPVALARLGNDEAIAAAAREISALTHTDPQASDACVLWCIGVDRAIREGRLDGVRDGLPYTEDPDRWAALLDEAEREPPSRFTPNGYVVTALQAAYAAVRQTPVPDDEPCRHLQDALHASVRIGDDTDTVAAIAGALVGARWGATAVPMAWRRLLHGWPGYRARDLVRLGVLALRRGESDAAGWPGATDLMSYYRAHHPSAPVAEELPGDPDVLLGNVHGVEGADVDVVLSFCRTGTNQVPDDVEHHELFLLDFPEPELNPNLTFLLRDTVDAIARWRDEGKQVLVHCVAAESRTPTIAVAYLVRHHGLDPDEALRRVRSVLPRAQPNPTFLRALG